NIPQETTVRSSKEQALQFASGLDFLSIQAWRLWMEYPSWSIHRGRKMKRLLFLFIAVIVFSALGHMSGAAQNDNQSKDARAAVNKFFLLLKSRSYPALYEFLPSDLQRQVTREQLALSLMRLDSFITIERMEVGRVQAHGDFAVINTTIYGRLKK